MGFQLLGHDNPIGEYPAPVVAVGTLQNATVVVYATLESRQKVMTVDQNVKFVLHNSKTNHKLDGFNHLKHRLFAFTEQDVIYYSISDEQQFFEELLQDSRIKRQNPFSRLSFARGSRNVELLRRETIACLKELQSQSEPWVDAFLESWYRVQLQMVSKYFPNVEALPRHWKKLTEGSALQVRKASAGYGRTRMTQQIVRFFVESCGSPGFQLRSFSLLH